MKFTDDKPSEGFNLTISVVVGGVSFVNCHLMRHRVRETHRYERQKTSR